MECATHRLHWLATKQEAKPAKGKANAFAKGKRIVIPNFLFDGRYLWYVKGFRGGIIIHWIKKPSREEEAFARKFFDDLKNNPQLLEELGFDLILNMRGDNGIDFRPQSPGSTWPWRVMVSCVGEEENTPENRREQADGGIKLCNSTAKKPHYKFPRNVRFADDLTGEKMCALDSILLDADVIMLMQAAYPTMTLEEMVDDEDLMADFWTDVDAGTEVVNKHIKLLFSARR